MVTISEFKITQRQLRDKKSKYKRFQDSDEDFLLVPAHWAGESRIIKKFLLRLQSLDMNIPFDYVETEAEKVDPRRPLVCDQGKFKFKLEILSGDFDPKDFL